MNSKKAPFYWTRLIRILPITALLLAAFSLGGSTPAQAQGYPERSFGVVLFQDSQSVSVHTCNWQSSGTLFLTLDKPDTSEDPDFYMNFQADVNGCGPLDFEYPVNVGDIITITDGVNTGIHVVRLLTITDVDGDAKTISGTAVPGDTIELWSPFNEEVTFEAVADQSGNWTAEYTGPYDISFGFAAVHGVYGNATMRIWNVPNQPPVADPNGPYVVAVNSLISFDGTLSYDPDNDTLTYNWSFKESDQSGPIVMYTTPSTAGIYLVTLTVDDGHSGTDTASSSVIVYDPSAGFVTGGGWIYSPDKASRPDLTLTGKATFGFVSKYKKGANVPEGITEFQFHAGDLSFHSDHYNWLIVTGSNYAKFMGKGTINGEGIGDELYLFQIWTGDNEPDTFRIKIWHEEDGAEVIVYDNGMDQAIGGGSIVIHTNNK